MTNKLQKKFYTWNILLLICAIICLVCYDFHGGLWLKGLTSTWFVILGFTNLVYARKMNLKMSHFLALIELGLCFGMCADVLLGVQFIFGILLFALGHVFYLVAFYSLERFHKKDVYIILPIAIVSLFVVVGTPYIQIEYPFIKKLLLGYAVIIACMLGKAVSNFTLDKSISRKLILLGSAMFWFSDLMLAIDMFGEASRLTWVLCSYTYWPAQNILAFSLFHYVNEQCGKSFLKSTSNTRAILPDSLRFLRSDVPNCITEEEKEWFIANNVTMVVDLRTDEERIRKECPLIYDKHFQYHCMPVTGGNIVPKSVDDVSKSYIKMVDEQMDKIVDTIWNANANVLYFCNSGKDRTGVVSAILLYKAGMSSEYIIEDYMKSRENLKNMLENYAKMFPDVDIDVITPRETYMQEFLKWLTGENRCK